MLKADIDATFADIAATGATTVRTWYVSGFPRSVTPRRTYTPLPGASMRLQAQAEPTITCGLGLLLLSILVPMVLPSLTTSFRPPRPMVRSDHGRPEARLFIIVTIRIPPIGLRLIVALTNNWSDYGGMDVYVKQVGLARYQVRRRLTSLFPQILNSANHDLFYSDASVIAAYKSYVSAFVGRYVNEPGILAW